MSILQRFLRFFKKEEPAPSSAPAPAAPSAPPAEIGTLLSPEVVFIGQAPEKKSELLKMLVEKICRKNPGIPLERAFQAVMEREKVTSTFMDTGVAVPHARLSDLSGNPAALAVLPSGFQTQLGPNTLTTHFVFLFFSPEKQLAEHLQILSKVSWLFQDKSLKDKLLKAKDPNEALTLIRETERQASHGS